MSKMTELQNAEVRIREVAERISNLREDLGISVEEMAANTGYSVEDYKKYESGEQDFSFTFIYKCANTFNVDITDENGILSGVQFVNEDKFNFAYDIVDAMAEKCPDKTAMMTKLIYYPMPGC